MRELIEISCHCESIGLPNTHDYLHDGVENLCRKYPTTYQHLSKEISQNSNTLIYIVLKKYRVDIVAHVIHQKSCGLISYRDHPLIFERNIKTVGIVVALLGPK